MSVKIEILDYKYGLTEGIQIITNPSFTSSADWSLGTGWTISGGSATHSGSDGYLRQNSASLVTPFVQGQKYRIIYKISGRTTGDLILANHLANNQNGFIQNQNGAFVYDWVQGASDKLSLYGSHNFDGSVEYVYVNILSDIDWDNSFVGELDVTEHSDFPLAITFQISDLRDLTSTSGDYSKTFKIPASKNNNKVLKHLFSPQSITSSKASNPKPCRIMVDGTQCLVGSIRITSIGGYNEDANYYDCVFFGNNTSWAIELEDEYMSDLFWGSNGEGLTYNKSSIMNT